MSAALLEAPPRHFPLNSIQIFLFIIWIHISHLFLGDIRPSGMPTAALKGNQSPFAANIMSSQCIHQHANKIVFKSKLIMHSSHEVLTNQPTEDHQQRGLIKIGWPYANEPLNQLKITTFRYGSNYRQLRPHNTHALVFQFFKTYRQTDNSIKI